jgi:glycine/D-amino acid oxidase-like deaminating enzyme
MNEFDVIVVGAGSAGICCAGELVLQGLRPLLIAESKEVAYQFHAVSMEGARTGPQFPTRNLYGEGGWWYSLARRLNVPVRVHRNQACVAVTVLGSGVVEHVPQAVSAADLADAIATLAPIPLGASRQNLEHVLHLGFTTPPDQLAGLHDVSFSEWLDKAGADELVKAILLSLGATMNYCDVARATELLSVYGFFAPVLAYLCGFAEMYSIEPDAREGLFVPLARAFEGRGGIVWRGQRAHRALVENGTAVGVVMADGTEARAPIVAMATNAERIAMLLDPLPEEVQAVTNFGRSLGDLMEYTTFTLVDRVFYQPPQQIIFTTSETGSMLQGDWHVSSLAPWVSRPGTDLIGSELVRSRALVEAEGGIEALHSGMRDITESLYPGFKDAILSSTSTEHPQFVTPFLTGPKLPRRSPSVPGLWFVGEGSFPVDGCFVDGAASAGVLGARSIADFLGQVLA